MAQRRELTPAERALLAQPAGDRGYQPTDHTPEPTKGPDAPVSLASPESKSVAPTSAEPQAKPVTE